MIEVLFKEEYFGFEETAIQYALNFYSFIEKNILLPLIKPTPNELKSKGSYYVIYKVNKNTTWYILFDRNDDKYLISHILNNHVEEAGYFNI